MWIAVTWPPMNSASTFSNPVARAISGDVLQLSGRARVDWNAARAARFSGAERVVDFEIDAVRETCNALPLRAGAAESSPFSP